jgi:hypothetical protein
LIRNNQNRRRRGGNGPRPQQMNGGNNYGNRLDNRQRGNASQLLEKYRALARDAQQAGDRVTAEYYLQYAEHYYRVLGDYRDKQPEQNRQRGRDFYEDDANGYGGDEAEAGDEDSTEAREDDRDDDREEPRADSRNDSRSDDGRSWQGERPRERNRDQQGREPRRDDNREQGAREQNRDQGNREQGGRERQPWNGDGQRRDRGERRDRPEQRDRRPERSEPRAESRPEPRAAEPAEGPIPGLPGPATLRINRPAEEPPAPVVSAVAIETEGEPAPRRRGRPRKVVADAEG